MIMLLLWNAINLTASDHGSSRSLIINVAGGYGYYLKSFVSTADEKSNLIRPGMRFRLIWQPEYRLRLGLESGYTSFYSVSKPVTVNNHEIRSDLGVIPLFLYFGMNVYKNFDLTFSTGGSLLKYKIADSYSGANSGGRVLSFSNFNAGIQWHRPLSERVGAGAGINYLFIGKTRDSHLSVEVSLSWKLLEKKLHTILPE